MATIEVFFDYTCPYCWYGHQYLMELLPKYPQLTIAWRPVEAHPRTSEPWYHPHSDIAIQGALFIRAHGGDELTYHKRVYHAVFEEKLPADSLEMLSACAFESGADISAFTHALRHGTYAQAQLDANTYAFAQNKVWAVPAFVYGEMRLDAVENVGVTPSQLNHFLAGCL